MGLKDPLLAVLWPYVTLPAGGWELRCLEGPAAPNAFRAFVEYWGLSEQTAGKALALGQCYADVIGSALWIISGYRTAEQQAYLRAQPDSMAAGEETSTHRTYPATGFDIGTDFELTEDQWWVVGQCAQCVGLRWGGGSPPRANGQPIDRNHFDEGRR